MVEKAHLKEAVTEPHVYANLSHAELLDHSLRLNLGFQIEMPQENGEVKKGAFRIETQKSARSPLDKYYVATESTKGNVWEKVNRPMSRDSYHRLQNDVSTYLQAKDMYIVDVALSADVESPMRKTFRFITESPVHAWFVKNLYRDLTEDEKYMTESFNYLPDFEILHAPGYKVDTEKHGTRSDTAIVIDYEEGTGVTAGTDYLGELKKLGFTALHYEAEKESTESKTYAIIHGSLIQKKDGTAVVIQGGSGAGKSSAPPTPTEEDRKQGMVRVADDEIIVELQNNSVRTIQAEGGFYFTVTNADHEDEIRYAAEDPTSILENVMMHPGTKIPNYTDTARTTNTRAAVDEGSIADYLVTGVSGRISDLICLDPDMRGVLDPVVKFRNQNQLTLYSLLGLGATIAGRERDINQNTEISSAWSDQPFLVYPPEKSIRPFQKIFKASRTDGWLVNSGLQGGPHGVGVRPPVENTKAAVEAIISGVLAEEILEEDPLFGWLTPKPTQGLDPRLTSESNKWQDQEEKERHRLIFARWVINEFTSQYGDSNSPEIVELAKELPRLSNTHDEVIFQQNITL